MNSKLSPEEKIHIVEGLVWEAAVEPNHGYASDGGDSEALLKVIDSDGRYRVYRRPLADGSYKLWLAYTPEGEKDTVEDPEASFDKDALEEARTPLEVMGFTVSITNGNSPSSLAEEDKIRAEEDITIR